MVYIQSLWHHKKKRLGTRILFGAVHLTSLGLVEGQMISTFLPCFPPNPTTWNLESPLPVLYLNFFAFQNLTSQIKQRIFETGPQSTQGLICLCNEHPLCWQCWWTSWLPRIHGPSRPTSNSPVLQPMVSWPDMVDPLRRPAISAGETWPATSPGATHESYTFLCWNLKGWQATNHVPINPQEFSDAILVYSDAMFVYFFCCLEVHRNRNCCKYLVLLFGI